MLSKNCIAVWLLASLRDAEDVLIPAVLVQSLLARAPFAKLH